MDFGAIQCKPKQPLCASCPLSEMCEAYREGTINDLPRKRKAAKKRHRYFYFLDLSPNSNTFPVIKRTEKDIWQNLYSLPYMECPEEVELISKDAWESSTGIQLWAEPQKVWETKHVLSHQLLHCRFFRIPQESTLKDEHEKYAKPHIKWISNPSEVTFPIVISKYYKNVNL